MKSVNERPFPKGLDNLKKRKNKKRRIIVNAIFISIGLLILFLWLFLEYFTLFRVTNWGKYYWQKIPWKEIISDPKSHIEPIIVFLVIGVIGIFVSIVYKKLKNKRKLEEQGRIDKNEKGDWLGS